MPLRIREFDPEKEDWRDYIEQVEQYFVAHDLNGDAKEPTKRALFLSGVGSTTYVTLKSLLAPAKPADKTFDEIVSTLTKHYSPPPSEVVQSYRFFTRVRQPGETVSAFVAALRRLAKDCNFGDTMERILRDKLVFSINDEVIQKKLLDEPKLTYKRALELAESAEAAARGQKEMRTPFQPAKTEPIHRATSKSEATDKESKGIVCHRCGKPGHLATVCRFKDKICHNCKKRGHIAKVCRSQAKPQRAPRTKRRSVHQVGEEPSTGDSEDSEISFVTANVDSGGSRGER